MVSSTFSRLDDEKSRHHGLSGFLLCLSLVPHLYFTKALALVTDSLLTVRQGSLLDTGITYPASFLSDSSLELHPF